MSREFRCRLSAGGTPKQAVEEFVQRQGFGFRAGERHHIGDAVDPRPVGQRLHRRPAGLQRMVTMGDDAHGHGGQRLAPQTVRQTPACVDAAAMQVAVAGFQQAQPLGPAGAAQPQLDLGKILPKAPYRFRHDRLHPQRIGGRPDAAGAARQGAADPVLGLLRDSERRIKVKCIQTALPPRLLLGVPLRRRSVP